MSTTTIRLGELKQRVVAAAEQSGKTPHAYIVDAIAQSVDRDERRAEFVGVARERRAKYLASGESVSFDDMKARSLALARGEGVSDPEAEGKGPPKLA